MAKASSLPSIKEEQVESDVESVMVVMILVSGMSWKNSLRTQN